MRARWAPTNKCFNDRPTDDTTDPSRRKTSVVISSPLISMVKVVNQYTKIRCLGTKIIWAEKSGIRWYAKIWEFFSACYSRFGAVTFIDTITGFLSFLKKQLEIVSYQNSLHWKVKVLFQSQNSCLPLASQILQLLFSFLPCYRQYWQNEIQPRQA